MIRTVKKIAYLLAIAALAVSGTTLVFSQQVNAPIVQTNAATNIFSNVAMLNGWVDPNGYNTNYYFEYGTSMSLGYSTQTISAGNGYANNNVSLNVSGLLSSTTYYFRLDAQNPYGATYGAILNFTTGSGYNTGGVSVETNAATDIYGVTAVLHAYVNTNNYPSTGWFDYGTDSNNLYLHTPSTTINPTSYYVANNNLNPFYTYQVINMLPNTKYYFRATIQNNGYTTSGQTLAFTTFGAPAPVYTYTYTPPAVTYTSPTYTPYTYTYTPTYQYSYQQPQVVYVPAEQNSYGNQTSYVSSYTNAPPQNMYYAPYYGMPTYIPSAQNSYEASALGVSGVLSGNQTRGLILLTVLIILVAIGFFKEAFL